MAGKSTGKKSFFEKVKGYFKGLKAEIRKINWPTGEQVLKQTLVVVIVSAILCGFIRLIDVLSQLLIETVSSIF